MTASTSAADVAIVRATRDWELLGAYPIPGPCRSSRPASRCGAPVRLAPGRYVCGDHRDTPPIQGALVSGRRGAAAVLADLTGAAAA